MSDLSTYSHRLAVCAYRRRRRGHGNRVFL